MEKKPQMIAKENEVAELKQLFEESESVVVADYRGITVAEDVQLRAAMRKADVEYRVSKNTLIRIASHQAELGLLDAELNGPTAIAFSKDPVAAAKVLGDFMKDHKNIKFKAGILTGKYMDAAGVEALAKLPSREILLAQVAGCFAAPMAALARVTNLVKEAKEAASAE